MNLEERLQQGKLPVRTLWTPEQTARIPAGVRRVQRRKAVRRGATVGALLSAVALVFVLRAPSEQQMADAAQSAPVTSPMQAGERAFADGSIAKLGPTATLDVERETAHSVVTRLRSGSAHFTITPNPSRTFQVLAQDVTVTVLGTAFTVEYLPVGAAAHVRVSVDRGLVRVAWPGGEQRLAAGEAGSFPPQRSETAEPVVVSPSAAQDHAAAAPREPGWRELAQRGDHKRAYEMLHADPAHAPGRTAADLMLEADVARLAGHPAEAVAPLQRVYTQFSGDKRAPLAAFTAGKILLDNLASPRRAAEAFRLARALGLQGALASDALARELSARSRAGQKGQARALAQEYLDRYPQGRHRALAERTLQ